MPSLATFFDISVTSQHTLHVLAFTISPSPLRYLTDYLQHSSIGNKVPGQVVSPLFSKIVPESRSVVTFSVVQGVLLSRNLVTVLHTSKMIATTALLVKAVLPWRSAQVPSDGQMLTFPTQVYTGTSSGCVATVSVFSYTSLVRIFTSVVLFYCLDYLLVHFG